MKNTLVKLLIIIVILSADGIIPVSAQDTCYVKSYGNLFSVKSFLYNYDFVFQNHEKGYKYIPDRHSGIGVGVWCKYFPFDVCYRRELSVGRSGYHSIKATDMQLRGYSKFFVGDIYIQKYSGFYENVKNRFQIKKPASQQVDEILYSPDITVQQFDMVGKYVFNHEQFSYKAGFTANESQLKSAGSFTVGAALYLLKIKSDSLLVKRDEADMKSCNLGINGGYAYNLVLGGRSLLFASGSVGINASNLFYQKKGVKDFGISPVLHLKGAYWLNFRKWSYGITGTFNIIHHTLDESTTIYVHSRRLEALVIRRLWCGK